MRKSQLISASGDGEMYRLPLNCGAAAPSPGPPLASLRSHPVRSARLAHKSSSLAAPFPASLPPTAHFPSTLTSKMGNYQFYAVARGHKVGVFQS